MSAKPGRRGSTGVIYPARLGKNNNNNNTNGGRGFYLVLEEEKGRKNEENWVRAQ